MRVLAFLSATAGAALALAACQGKPSAVATSATAGTLISPYAANSGGQTRTGDPRDLPVPQVDGKPMWAANRKHSAEENAEFQFGKNGGDFGASSETDYVAKAHAFIERPPHDVQTLARDNGDKLMYDPKENVFVVVASTGAPRTMFKPKEGVAYWAQQKDREVKRAKTGQDAGSDQG